MINIFHGDNQVNSRNTFLSFLDNYQGDVLRLNYKQVNIDKINNFLEGQSLFESKKMLAISNLFSIPKANLDKIIPIFKKTSIDIAIWQDKKLTPTQIKSLGQTKENIFALDKNIFLLLRQIIPKNRQKFFKLYHELLKTQAFDLLFFWIKRNIRQQLNTYTRFDKNNLKKTYLKLIDLDYHNKSGKLNIPREIGLERILLELLS
jgi:hypothetical protein